MAYLQHIQESAQLPTSSNNERRLLSPVALEAIGYCISQIGHARGIFRGLPAINGLTNGLFTQITVPDSTQSSRSKINTFELLKVLGDANMFDRVKPIFEKIGLNPNRLHVYWLV